MKNSKEIVIVAVALAAAFFIPNLHAQEGKGEGKGPRGPRPGMELLGERAAKELGLTADQQSQIKAINESYRPQMEALREDKSLSQEQRREKAQALNKERQAKVDAVLTPEQLQKAKAMREKARDRMKERRGGKGEDGPGHDGPPPPKGE